MLVMRGDIWWCNLDGNKGSEQGKTRPVLVVSNNRGNESSPVINIVPITTRKTNKKLPVHVHIDECEAVKDGTILIEQIRAVDKSRLLERSGRVSDDVMEDVVKAMRIQFCL